MQRRDEDDVTEVWKAITGYEGAYEVSNQGRVRSLPRESRTQTGVTRSLPGKLLSLGTTDAGYHVVALSKDGKATSQNVHVLVAQAFHLNPEGLPLVRHLNDIGSDNRSENLAWGTYSQNRRDAVKSGSYVNQYYQATHCIRNHQFDEENTYLIPSGGRACRECRRDEHKKRSENDCKPE